MQVVLGVVGGALGLIAAAIGVLGPRGEDGPAPISNDIDTPSSSIRGEDTRLPSPINEILAELQVSEENRWGGECGPRFQARYVLADGGDNLLGLGCVLGLEWLDAAIGLYGGSLQGWAVDEEPLERAITQNNLGVALLLMGMEDAYGGDASAMLRRSVDALAQASEVFMFQGERQDTNAAIVYTNSEQANWELLALDPGNLELLENHAVAESGVIAVQTRALASGGPRSVEQLDDRRRSMQIVSTRQDTGAQRLRLTGDRDSCRRPL